VRHHLVPNFTSCNNEAHYKSQVKKTTQVQQNTMKLIAPFLTTVAMIATGTGTGIIQYCLAVCDIPRADIVLSVDGCRAIQEYTICLLDSDILEINKCKDLQKLMTERTVVPCQVPCDMEEADKLKAETYDNSAANGYSVVGTMATTVAAVATFTVLYM